MLSVFSAKSEDVVMSNVDCSPLVQRARAVVRGGRRVRRAERFAAKTLEHQIIREPVEMELDGLYPIRVRLGGPGSHCPRYPQRVKTSSNREIKHIKLHIGAYDYTFGG